MTGGISLSLNSTLARLNAIENGFKELNNVSFELDLNKTNSSYDVAKQDFSSILKEKTNPEEEIPKTPEVKHSAEIKEDDLSGLDEIKKEAVNLKSKIDLKAQTTDVNEIIETFSEKYGVDSDFIKAIIKQESGFNSKATSKKGAMGLMQLMPSTAKSLGINDAYNPWENIEGGVRHLKGLLDKYSNNRELALAAYNAGEGAVKRYGGIPPYKETQNYVKSIMGTYNKVKEAKI